MRLRVLLGLTVLLLVCLVALATVLATAEILAAVGNASATAVFRYVGLAIGCMFGGVLVLLVVWISFIQITELARAAVVEQGVSGRPETLQPTEEEPFAEGAGVGEPEEGS